MILRGEKGNHNVLATTTERSSGELHKPVWIQTRCGREIHKEKFLLFTEGGEVHKDIYFTFGRTDFKVYLLVFINLAALFMQVLFDLI